MTHATPHPPPGLTAPGTGDDRRLEHLIACPSCDALYTARMPAFGQQAVCETCHTVLIQPRRKAGIRILMLSLAILILVVAALFFPFLEISRAGLSNRASLLDVALSFRSERMAALALATAAVIVVVPLLRMLLITYVLLPIVLNARPFAQARRAFRWSQELKPWSMAEIFVLGVAVALVKVADLAQIAFGAAFWMFLVLVGIAILNERYMCSYSVWASLDELDR